jgi:hypothetical protein
MMRWRVKKVTVVQKNDVTPIDKKEHHADARSHPTRVNCRTANAMVLFQLHPRVRRTHCSKYSEQVGRLVGWL